MRNARGGKGQDLPGSPWSRREHGEGARDRGVRGSSWFLQVLATESLHFAGAGGDGGFGWRGWNLPRERKARGKIFGVKTVKSRVYASDWRKNGEN